MKTPVKAVVVLGVVAAAVGMMVLKPAPVSSPDSAVATGAKLPRLLDLGTDKCVPCKMMAPILADLKKQYAGRMTVEFIDIWKDPDAGEKYGVEMIPTQIFFNAEGRELFRHSGFLAREDILSKWKELGVPLP